VQAVDGGIEIDGKLIQSVSERDPGKLPWGDLGVDLVIESTGFFTNGEKAAAHIEAGAKKVIISAPATNEDKTLVLGVNAEEYDPSIHHVVSNASCTTNCVATMIKVLHDSFGVKHGLMTTVHAYTNDQNLQDNFHKKNRRGRSAPLNMVITETGATNAIVKLIPELQGKLTGNAIRVPTPNVSLAILNLTLGREVTVEEVNDFLRHASLHSGLQRQMEFTMSPEVVSSDFVSNRHACIVDGGATLGSENRVVLYVWYDNEFGYACQVIRVVQKWSGIRYPLIPADVAEIGFG